MPFLKSSFLRLLLHLCLGILLCYFQWISIHDTLLNVLFGLGFLLFFCISFLRLSGRPKSALADGIRVLRYISLAVLVFVVGYLRTADSLSGVGEEIEASEWLVRVDGVKKLTSGNQALELKAFDEAERGLNMNGLLLDSTVQIQKNAWYLMKSRPQVPSGPQYPFGFDYGAYLETKGIGQQVFLRAGDLVLYQSADGFSLKILAGQLRAELAKKIEGWSDRSDVVGLYKSILLGDKSGLDVESKEQFSDLGIAHVLAVSGLHVGALYLMLGLLLRWVPKKLRIILVIVGIWLFALISGLSPSVCRASFMFSMMSLGDLFGRRQTVYHSIMASAFVLLVINPLLLFQLGFQLSYLAVIGIVSLHEPIMNLFSPRRAWVKWLLGLLVLSFTAQLATAPLTIYHFHQFPVGFLISNLWVVPFIGLLLYVGLPLLMIDGVFALPVFLKLSLEKLAGLMLSGVELIQSYASKTLFVPELQAQSVYLIYLLIISMGYGFLKRSGYWKTIALFSLGMLLLVQLNHSSAKAKQAELYVLKHQTELVFVEILGNQITSTQANLEGYISESLKHLSHKRISNDSLIQQNQNLTALKQSLIYHGNFTDTVGLGRSNLVVLNTKDFVPPELIPLLQEKSILLHGRMSKAKRSFLQKHLKFHEINRGYFKLALVANQ